MDEEASADYAGLVVNQGDPPGGVMLRDPRRALVRVELHGGAVVILDLYVVAEAEGYVRVSQARTGKTPWLAWVPAQDATLV